MQPHVNIIIVNWNGYEDTSELLNSLKTISYKNYSITIVDNNSSGDDVKKIETEYHGCLTLITSEVNLGFGGGNNLAIRTAMEGSAEYILLLNNDTIVEPGFLDVLVNKMNSMPGIGMTAPQINYYSQPDEIWSAGGIISWLRASGFAKTDIKEDKLPKKDRLVEFISGCCMLIKKEVIAKIGLFDEDYFLYLEDTDLCLRTLREGYKILITPESKIYHKVKRSSNKVSVTPLYYETRNRLYFAKKNYPITHFIPLLYVAGAMGIKCLLWLINGNKDRMSVVLLAFRDYFIGKMGKTEILRKAKSK
jgi:GT2 family glycosyltransferase